VNNNGANQVFNGNVSASGSASASGSVATNATEGNSSPGLSASRQFRTVFSPQNNSNFMATSFQQAALASTPAVSMGASANRVGSMPASAMTDARVAAVAMVSPTVASHVASLAPAHVSSGTTTAQGAGTTASVHAAAGHVTTVHAMPAAHVAAPHVSASHTAASASHGSATVSVKRK
jgi:hypothetical protein